MEEHTGVVHINGVRVVDKSKAYPIFKIELWIDTKDEMAREKIKDLLTKTITHGLPQHKAAKNNPRFEWKGH
jgi:translation initiation factor 4E